MKNYSELAQITAAPVTKELLARLKKTSVLRVIAKKLLATVGEASILDLAKGHVFYGKEDKDGLFPESIDTHPAATRIDTLAKAKLIHGLLGIITEAAEIAELMAHWLFDKDCVELDVVHLVEELGDIEWFSNEVREVIGVSQEQVQEINIAKLKKRYGAKFTEHEAKNRDLEAERAVLEGKEENHDQAVS